MNLTVSKAAKKLVNGHETEVLDILGEFSDAVGILNKPCAVLTGRQIRLGNRWIESASNRLQALGLVLCSKTGRPKIITEYEHFGGKIRNG